MWADVRVRKWDVEREGGGGGEEGRERQEGKEGEGGREEGARRGIEVGREGEFWESLTALDAIYLINESLVGQLC